MSSPPSSFFFFFFFELCFFEFIIDLAVSPSDLWRHADQPPAWAHDTTAATARRPRTGNNVILFVSQVCFTKALTPGPGHAEVPHGAPFHNITLPSLTPIARQHYCGAPCSVPTGERRPGPRPGRVCAGWKTTGRTITKQIPVPASLASLAASLCCALRLAKWPLFDCKATHLALARFQLFMNSA